MRQADADVPEVTALIAPGEIEELLARLTESTVEGVPFHQARTLEGLAVETGIPVGRLQDELSLMRGRRRISVPPIAIVAGLLMAGYGYWLIQPREPKPNPAPVAAPPAVEKPDLSGLVPLGSVTYGPDSGPDMVDATFEPSNPMPEGLSVSASTGGVLWGAGDHRAAVLSKLTPEMEAALRQNVVELLRYARMEAARRHLPMTKGQGGGGYLVNLFQYSYYGAGGANATLPPPGAANDKAAERQIAHAAKALVEQIKDNIRRDREWKRDMGP